MVTLTIDGRTVEVPEGTTVLRAAEKAGIKIPTLCDHPHLQPFGGCRVCVVEVEGLRTLQPSCTLPVSQNMVVRTNTPKVLAARKFVLTLIFSDRNHFCPYCQVSGGDCELQNTALDMGMTHWDYQPAWKPYPVDASHPNLVIDHNRCILCRCCVRACGELVGNYTLGIEERGANSMLIADTGVPFGESTCISCGTCSQVCPTGAIIDRRSAYQGLEKKTESTRTICVQCSVGCGVEVLTRDNRMVRILGDWDATVNGGVICKLGRFDPLDDSRERIKTPMVRKDGKLQPASWDEALEAIAQTMKTHQGKGIAALVSPRLPAEAMTAFTSLFKEGLHAEMVASMDGRGMASRLAGEAGVHEDTLDVLLRADCVVTVGLDLYNDHQVLGFFIKRRLNTSTALVVMDSRENRFAEYARIALKPAAGKESFALQALAAAVREGHNGASGKFGELASKAGLSEAEIAKVADLIRKSGTTVFVYGEGLDEASVKALLEVVQQAGENARLVSAKGAANSLLAGQLGLSKPFSPKGYSTVFVALGDDEPSNALIQQLEGTEFLAVAASHVSRLTAMANVVLPVEMWAEQEGTYINLEGRVQKAHAALRPAEWVRPSTEAIIALGKLLDVPVSTDWQKAFQNHPSPVMLIGEPA